MRSADKSLALGRGKLFSHPNLLSFVADCYYGDFASDASIFQSILISLSRAVGASQESCSNDVLQQRKKILFDGVAFSVMEGALAAYTHATQFSASDERCKSFLTHKIFSFYFTFKVQRISVTSGSHKRILRLVSFNSTCLEMRLIHSTSQHVIK